MESPRFGNIENMKALDCGVLVKSPQGEPTEGYSGPEEGTCSTLNEYINTN